MSATPLPGNLPSAAQVQARLEAAHLALEALQHQVMASLATAQLYATRLMQGETTPDELLAALREVHDAATAMLEPAQEMFTQLLEAQKWAEGLSWDALAVPLRAGPVVRNAKAIPLASGAVTIVDEDVYEWAIEHSWCLFGRRYAGRREPGGRKAHRKTLYLHRLIVGAPDGVAVDHINHDTLDNRRANLRLATASENQQNIARKPPSASGVRGVHWDKRRGKWWCQIKLHQKNHFLGYFDSLEDATRVISEARRRLHPFAPVSASGERSK